MTEDRGTHRTCGETDEEGRQRQQRADIGIRSRKELLRKDERRGDAVEEEVVPLDRGADRRRHDGANDLLPADAFVDGAVELAIMNTRELSGYGAGGKPRGLQWRRDCARYQRVPIP
jgi:hypothetical protein